MAARSSAEAKFRASSQGICEGIWLKRLLSELRIQVNSPMEVKCDNLAAISIAKHPVHHDRTKHVEIDRHFIMENLDSENINLSHTPSQLQRREKGIGLAGWDTCVSLSSKYGQPLAEDMTPLLLVS
ncbi:Retrovirus-related Pol polyprotein from transposon RE2 [Senna tora]|uniref:Retrovirus-related Pol polyprotein from transposon RE2 n=1 Tax=Senna tora TaxID=362788 RepID=A0A834SUQ4_9FABA|nr:Retrovirus-related Pol polyprotein from transposon RE2 [Senna tora]